MNCNVLQGDALEMLRTLPDESVNCCVTSPPYWGLRDYGNNGQIGLEPTLAEYISKLVAVFDEVRRVLRPDGTCWVNMGDSYASSGGGGEQGVGGQRAGRRHTQENLLGSTTKACGLKPKNLVGAPWRLAFALQDSGWYLRQDIIWSKPNPMPESVTDRCTKSHEYLFLLSKSERYFWDMEAMLEKANRPEGSGNITSKNTTAYTNGDEHHRTAEGLCRIGGRETRNRRSVWTICTEPYPDAHFATFPTALVSPCILAGCPVGGTVLDPFAGSGTTGAVALELGRNAILIELSDKYCELIRHRLNATTPGFAFTKPDHEALSGVLDWRPGA